MPVFLKDKKVYTFTQYRSSSSALLLRTARRRRTLPLGVKCEKAAPAQARRKQNRLWWLRNCLLAFPHLPVGADIGACAFLRRQKMKIYDLHCDVLYKLAKAESPISFIDSPLLQANKERLKAGKVALQVFAVFVSEGFPKEKRFMEAVRQIEFFHTEIVGKHDDIVAIYKWDQLETLQEGQIGAVLSLEGLDMINGDIEKLKLLLSHGVKLVGLTWNGANASSRWCGGGIWYRADLIW